MICFPQTAVLCRVTDNVSTSLRETASKKCASIYLPISENAENLQRNLSSMYIHLSTMATYLVGVCLRPGTP